VVAKIRSKTKRKSKTFWKKGEDAERAQPYLEILVRALLSPIPEGCSRSHLLSVPVSTELFEQFRLLQVDLGLSSQEKALLYCVKYTLANKGIQNEKDNTGSNQLWFMHVPSS
jgi:hypothetical protein